MGQGRLQLIRELFEEKSRPADSKNRVRRRVVGTVDGIRGQACLPTASALAG